MSKTILTNVGLATIAAVTSAGGTIKLKEMAVGDGAGNEVEPTANQSSLVRETYRATINHLSPNPNNPNEIIAELVIPTEVGGFVVREVGLFDSNNNLIAVGSYPAAVKPTPDSGAMSEMIIRLVIAVSNTAGFEVVVDPTIVIATRQWCRDYFSLSIQLPGGATGQVLRKKSNADGDIEWYDPASGMTILVDSIEENQQLIAGQSDITLFVATTAGAAVYIDGRRLRSDEWTVVSNNQIRLNAAAPAAARVTILQNEQLSKADFLRTANRLSEIKDAGANAQKDALKNLGLPGSIDDIAAAILKKQYPLGALYHHTEPTDPALILGFGTWERYAKGLALVGVDENDADFNAAGKTSGSKTVQLGVAHLPKFRATMPEQTLKLDQVGDHTHEVYAINDGGTWGPTDGFNNSGWDAAIAGESGGSHGYITQNSKGKTLIKPGGAHTPTGKLPLCQTNEVGGDQAHGNVQPSIAIYIWRRKA